MSIVNIEEAVKQRIDEEKRKRAPEAANGGGEPPITFVEECFAANEVGDSQLYNHLNRKRFVYNPISAKWLVYVGPHWEPDWSGKALAAVENTVVQQYLRLLDYYDEKMAGADKAGRKSLKIKKGHVLGRIRKLRAVTGRNNCLSCARSNSEAIVVMPDQFDKHPMLLPVKNGVVDMATGILRPGTPEDWLTRYAPAEWKGVDEECPLFENYLLNSLDDRDKYEYLHKLLGYAATGLSNESVFAVLWGKRGRNGKDLLMETLFACLGNLIGPIPSEMLLAGTHQRNSAGVSPDIMSLKGRRLVWGSEVDQNTRWAIGEIKRYSGGGTLVGRNPHDKEPTEFSQTHTLFMLTNYKPHAPADDNAFFERVRIISWPLSFVTREPENPWERKADLGLKEKLLEERSGILAWLVRGYIKYADPVNGGLVPPECILKDTADYRTEEDVLVDFMDDCCDIGSEHEEQFGALYTKYKDWWISVSANRKPLTRKKFGMLLKDKYDSVRRKHGIVYFGLKLKLPLMEEQHG